MSECQVDTKMNNETDILAAHILYFRMTKKRTEVQLIILKSYIKVLLTDACKSRQLQKKYAQLPETIKYKVTLSNVFGNLQIIYIFCRLNKRVVRCTLQTERSLDNTNILHVIYFF